MRQRVLTGTPLPKALACGILEDEGRILFLTRRAASGPVNTKYVEYLELPMVLVVSGRSPLAEIRAEFQRQTGIEGQVHEIIFEDRYNAGSKKRRIWVPCLGFKITARERRAKPANEFTGFKWLSLENAKNERLGRRSEWLKRIVRSKRPSDQKHE